jgi:beta-lactamase superfamily II metal-dependent hydrolase
MEVVFVDVGFGTCNVIHTGSGEAIVIDVGGRSKEPLAVLHHLTVRRIRHLVVSHWHEDHVGGATGVLRAFSGNIGNVWFPADPAFKRTEFWRALVAECEAGNLKEEQVEALMVQGVRPRRIWQSKPRDAELSIVSPCFMEASRGVAAGDSNATCGVLVLRAGGRFVVFAGDAILSQWQQVSKRVAVPITADVLAVPHHAGIMWPDHWSDSQVATTLDNLYAKIVQPRVAVVSASTRPGTTHPREDVVAAVRRAGGDVMCTQITDRCTPDLENTRRMRTALPILAPGRASMGPLTTKHGGLPNEVACAGSVVVELLPSGVTIHQLSAHQALVGKLSVTAGARPICRR